MILSVDPGIRHCGASLLGPALVAATLIKNPVKRGNGLEAAMAMALEVAAWARSKGTPSTVVVERMRYYPDGRSPGDPNVTLFPLIGVAHAVAALFPEAEHHEYIAREWKGTLDGVLFTQRIRERLTDSEFATIKLPPTACARCRARLGSYCVNGEEGCGADHVFDAVGIGLKSLGRLDRVRVFPR